MLFSDKDSTTIRETSTSWCGWDWRRSLIIDMEMVIILVMTMIWHASLWLFTHRRFFGDLHKKFLLSKRWKSVTTIIGWLTIPHNRSQTSIWLNLQHCICQVKTDQKLKASVWQPINSTSDPPSTFRQSQDFESSHYCITFLTCRFDSAGAWCGVRQAPFRKHPQRTTSDCWDSWDRDTFGYSLTNLQPCWC